MNEKKIKKPGTTRHAELLVYYQKQLRGRAPCHSSFCLWKWASTNTDRGAWLAWWEECMTLNLWIVTLGPTLGVQITKKIKLKKIYRQLHHYQGHYLGQLVKFKCIKFRYR